ncbi:hypothetical protein DFH06DRAFT_380688 [Mycena polygramma]|nr:hypothetical protein DFH06DRAFT_380688 [Mycena polygramma]
MESSAANRVPDELISEILTPLLKHSDEVFSDRSEKALLDPGYSSSTYLLVCKAWFRVATPLLYNVVILRTTPQAESLRDLLKSHPEVGPFIKKLRVEGGFGNAMHTILHSAPNVTDLFLTLFIWGSDSVRGLASGLPLINPRRVIVVDVGAKSRTPKKNKQVNQLLQTLVACIPKWDNLRSFDHPYIVEDSLHPTCAERSEALISALGRSSSIETLIVRTGFLQSVSDGFRQISQVPSMKSLQLVNMMDIVYSDDALHTWVNDNAKVKAIVTLIDG